MLQPEAAGLLRAVVVGLRWKRGAPVSAGEGGAASSGIPGGVRGVGWVPGWWAAAWAGSPLPGNPGAWWRGSPWAHGVGTSPPAAPACGTTPPAARFWGPQARGPPLGPGRGSLTCTSGRASAPAWPPAALQGAGTLSTGLSPSAPRSPRYFILGWGPPVPPLASIGTLWGGRKACLVVLLGGGWAGGWRVSSPRWPCRWTKPSLPISGTGTWSRSLVALWGHGVAPALPLDGTDPSPSPPGALTPQGVPKHMLCPAPI